MTSRYRVVTRGILTESGDKHLRHDRQEPHDTRHFDTHDHQEIRAHGGATFLKQVLATMRVQVFMRIWKAILLRIS